MDDIKGVRDYFGWSQETLAFYLSVSRSLIKLAEAGERYLSSAAIVKFARLQTFVSEAGKTSEQPPAAPVAPTAKGEGKKLLRYARQYEAMAEKCRLQLEDVQRRYEQLQHNLALHQHLYPTTVADATDEQEKDDALWLNLIQARANLKMRRFGPAAQAELQWKIDCYAYAAGRAKELGGT